MRGMPTYRYTQFVEHYRRYAQTLTDLTGGTLRSEYAAFVSTNRRHYLPPSQHLRLVRVAEHHC
jgi:hypothetical protein